MITPVGYTYGHPETLSPIACKTLLHSMGVSDPEKFFDGSMSDKEVIAAIYDLYKTNPNIDKSKFPESFEALIAPRIREYCGKMKQHDKYLADNPPILEGLLANCEDVYGKAPSSGAPVSDDKKKQITA